MNDPRVMWLLFFAGWGAFALSVALTAIDNHRRSR